MESSLIANTIEEALDLELLDRDLYRGINVLQENGPALYGGQVAAQALMAAANTVSDDRRPHSLHGYFLRPGKPQLPVILRVDRDRDGGSFSARHVAAIQDGEVIFSMLASFQSVPDEEIPSLDASIDDFNPPSFEGVSERHTLLMDIRELPSVGRDDVPESFVDYFQVRSSAKIPDDPMIQACALTYLSDIGSGFRKVWLPGLSNGGTSIDHVLWFHEPVRADEWITCQMWPSTSLARRGLYLGHMRDANNTLAGVLGQESLLRLPKGAPAT